MAENKKVKVGGLVSFTGTLVWSGERTVNGRKQEIGIVEMANGKRQHVWRWPGGLWQVRGDVDEQQTIDY